MRNTHRNEPLDPTRNPHDRNMQWSAPAASASLPVRLHMQDVRPRRGFYIAAPALAAPRHWCLPRPARYQLAWAFTAGAAPLAALPAGSLRLDCIHWMNSLMSTRQHWKTENWHQMAAHS